MKPVLTSRGQPRSEMTCRGEQLLMCLNRKKWLRGLLEFLAGQGRMRTAWAALPLCCGRQVLTVYAFPAGHLNEMAKIIKAEYLCPIHIVPYLTSKRINERFGSKTVYIELPVGIAGTTNFLRGVADLTGSNKLKEIADREEKRSLPRLEKIREQFRQKPTKVLLVSGPANETSMGKILAEFGAEVIIVPSMRNAFARQEQDILQKRYGSRIIFHENDFNKVSDLVGLYKPDVVFGDFQARVEVIRDLIPCLINENYLNEYGYDYALDFGENFFENLKQPFFTEWKDIMSQYGGSRTYRRDAENSENSKTWNSATNHKLIWNSGTHELIILNYLEFLALLQ